MSRRTALVSLLLVTVACQKATRTRDPDVPEPEDLILRAAAASPQAVLERVRAYADAVSPGSGGSLATPMIAQGLAFVVQTPQLEGLDVAKPTHVLLLDPKKFARPLVIVGAVADEAKLKAASNVTVEVKDGRAVIGEASAVQALSAYGFAIAALPAPEAVTFTLSPKKIVARYRKEIDEFRASMGNLMATQSPAIGRILEVEIDLLSRLADQSERMQLSVDAPNGEAVLEMAMFPTAGSAFEKFNAAQKPGVNSPLLARLPAVEKPSMIMSGHYELGPARDAILDLMGGALEALADKKLDAGLRARLGEWFGMFDGELAMIGWNGAGGGMHMIELFGVSDGKKAAATGREILAPLFGGARATQVMGLEMSVAAKSAVATHDGVEIDEYRLTVDTSKLPEMQRDMMRRMYGEDGLRMYVAGFDKSFAVTLGVDGAAQMPRLIDAARKGGAAVELPAAFAASVQRKSSMASLLDYTQLLAAMVATAPPAAKSGVLADFGVSDGAARLRIGVPAEHVKEITAMLGGAR